MNLLCRSDRRCLYAAFGATVASWPVAALASTGTSSVDLLLQGAIAPRCEFRGAPQQLTISPQIDPTASSPLGFACNLPDAQPVSLTISSANGALKRDNSDPGLTYTISWNVNGTTPVSAFTPGSDATNFSVDAGPAGTERPGVLTVALLQPSATPGAGTYSDQITFSLSP